MILSEETEGAKRFFGLNSLLEMMVDSGRSTL